jgi:mono/diheme cytochrome c family protein
MRSALFAAALAATVAAASASAQQPNPLPAGDGHDVVAVACTQCHGPSAFMQLRVSQDAWRLQVYDMILRGAQVGPDDIDKVVDYLAINFGPGVNVPQGAAVTLPDGAGKDVVEKNCVLCHGLDRIADTKRSAGQWDAIVARMVALGAPLSGDDKKAVTGYLDGALAVK